jgi:hypothetical protein
MASGFGVTLILIGALLMALSSGEGYGYAAKGLPLGGPFGLYLGVIFLISGMIILLGPNAAKRFGRLRGSGSDSTR